MAGGAREEREVEADREQKEGGVALQGCVGRQKEEVGCRGVQGWSASDTNFKRTRELCRGRKTENKVIKQSTESRLLGRPGSGD